MNTSYAIYTKIINNRLKNIIENIIGEKQSELQKGRSCTDNISTFNQKTEERRENNLETNLAVTDSENSFDRVINMG